MVKPSHVRRIKPAYRRAYFVTMLLWKRSQAAEHEKDLSWKKHANDRNVHILQQRYAFMLQIRVSYRVSVTRSFPSSAPASRSRLPHIRLPAGRAGNWGGGGTKRLLLCALANG